MQIQTFMLYLITGALANMKYRQISYVYGDSVVECLIRDQGVADSSLAGVIALCP